MCAKCISSMDLSTLSYIGEGNANIVFCSGEKVVRISKGKIDAHQQTKYIQRVICKLVGEKYVGSITTQEISPQAGMELILQTRREKELDASHDPRHITIMENHTLISPESQSNYSFEIKPKWGFLPIGSQTCRFHKHASLKGKQANLDFCPLDLFSNDKMRIKNAITQLMSVNTNNWRVFADSKMVPFKNHDSVIASMFTGETSNARSVLAHVLADIIFNDELFSLLKSRQKSLDNSGIVALKAMVEVYADWSDFSIDTDDADWDAIVAAFLQKSDTLTDAGVNDIDDLRQLIYEYIISMTLKDCSIFITLFVEKATAEPTTSTYLTTHRDHPISKNLYDAYTASGSIELLDNTNIQYKIRMVDLDLKIPKLKYWHDLDQEINLAYESIERPRICIE